MRTAKKNPKQVSTDTKKECPTTCQQAEDMVLQWLLKQDYKTKLACMLLESFGIVDHGTEDIRDKVMNQYAKDIMKAANNPNTSISHDETIMTGIAAELMIWRNRY